MAPSSRDRISVDLRGLKAALFARAEAQGVSPSSFVRTALVDALGQAREPGADQGPPPCLRGEGNRARLTLRMSRDHAHATLRAARRAGLSAGDYVAGLVSNVPVLSAGDTRVGCIRALTASSAELATLSRNIHRLTVLLRQADVEAARPYRDTLATLAVDVRRHLELAAGVLAELQPHSHGAPDVARVPH
jgi:hypothetical protein